MKKYAHTIQEDIFDCGAACIRTTLMQHGLNPNLHTLEDILGTDVDGTNVKGMLVGLQNFGFKAKALRMKSNDIDSIRGKVNFPFIALVDGDTGNHYVVIHNIKGNKLIISDPSEKKIISKTFNEFNGQFKGILIVIISMEKIEKGYFNKKNNVLNQIGGILLKNKLNLLFIFIFSIFVVLLGIVASFFMKIVVDSVIPSGLDSTLNTVVYIFLAISIMKVFLEFIQGKLTIKFSRKLEISLSDKFFSKLFKIPISFYKRKENGDFISRLNDISYLREVISGSAISSIVDVSLIIITGVVLYFQNKLLFVTSIVPIILYVTISYLFVDRIQRQNKDFMESHANVTAFLIQSIKGIDNIYSLNKQTFIFSILTNKFKNFQDNAFNVENTTNLSIFFNGLVRSTFSILIVWIGVKQILNDSTSLGNLLTFNALLGFFVGSIDRLVNLQPQIQKSIVAAQRFFNIVNYNNDQFPPGDIVLESINDISVRNLSFGYSNDNEVLNNLTFEVNENDMIAVTGPSGIGKSTLAKLLVKLYECGNNEIFINNIDINLIDTKGLRNKIMYLSPDSFFIRGTVYENLCLGNEYSVNEITTACKKACIFDFISTLPDGLETLIQEGGGNLSSGQKQRLALARGFLVRPEVFILDEITSNIDQVTNKEILKNLKGYKGIKIIITHKTNDSGLFNRVLEITPSELIEREVVTS